MGRITKYTGITLVTLLIVFLCFIIQSEKHVIVMAMHPIIREMENGIVAFQVRNYSELETENFIIRYGSISKEALEKISYISEEKYLEITKIFGASRKEKIVIVVHDDEESFNNLFLIRDNPLLGMYYGGALHINGLNLIEKEWDFDTLWCLENTVLHEMVHLFTDHLGKGNFPAWFTEGVSLYFEYRINGYEWGREVEVPRDEYTISKLQHSFYELNQDIAYTQSFRLVKKFVDKKGVVSLVELISKLGDGEKLEKYYCLFE
ncbi:MAG: hypothetical protein COA82_01950 [Alkaliphilus sp.]|nr:hypothetical protein [bacterium AH-315-L21]MBN4069547.1 hypothetical protein [bacterium AH-315-G05]MBN4069566.1 hypothetical protein [bacterium AH-315-G05]PHS36065.1 MAG: hypothetical protein COA82_01950 [Alkaliphilus sp.]